MHPTKFRFIWPSSFRVEDFYMSTNQKHELPVTAMYKYCSFRRDPLANMAVIGNSCFWVVDF
jgi:hypothetical protein